MKFHFIVYSVLLFCSPLWSQDNIYVHTDGNLYTHSTAQLSVFGDIINDTQGGINHSGGGTVYIRRHAQQGTGPSIIISGDNAATGSDNYNSGGAYIRVYNLVTDNSSGNAVASGTEINASTGSGDINIEQELRITNAHTFQNGIVWTPRAAWQSAFVLYESNASYVGDGNNRHIDGYAATTRAGDFDFPVGDGVQLRQAGIVDAANGTFKVAYFNKNPQNGTTGISGNNASTGPVNGGLERVANSEFWDIDGTANTRVKLTSLNSVSGYSDWNTTDNFESSDPSLIVLTGFDPWENLANLSPPGSLNDDAVLTSDVFVTPDPDFSAFTWASTDALLPIELLSFNAIKQNNYVKLSWSTSFEINNSKFEVESLVSSGFKKIGEVQGSNQTYQITDYSFIDVNPMKGENYYRLKQIDVDGSYSFTSVIRLVFNSSHKLLLYPNPANSELNIQLNSEEGNDFEIDVNIYNQAGQLITKPKYILNSSMDLIKIDVSDLISGEYIVKVSTGLTEFNQKFVKN